MQVQRKTKLRKVRKLFGIFIVVIFLLSGIQYAYAQMTCSQTNHQGSCYTYICNNGWGGTITFTCCGANICADY